MEGGRDTGNTVLYGWTELCGVKFIRLARDSGIQGIKLQDFHTILAAVRGTTGRWRATHTTRQEKLRVPPSPNLKLKTAQASGEESCFPSNAVNKSSEFLLFPREFRWANSPHFTLVPRAQVLPNPWSRLPAIHHPGTSKDWSTSWRCGWGHLPSKGSCRKEQKMMFACSKRKACCH